MCALLSLNYLWFRWICLLKNPNKYYFSLKRTIWGYKSTFDRSLCSNMSTDYFFTENFDICSNDKVEKVDLGFDFNNALAHFELPLLGLLRYSSNL